MAKPYLGSGVRAGYYETKACNIYNFVLFQQIADGYVKW